jgi:predicted nucleic acid-binding protein
VRLVIADTGPVNYLILIGCIQLLPRLFEKVMLPGAVCRELSNPGAPQEVRNWIAKPPCWLEIREPDPIGLAAVSGLDEGESAAIALASVLNADLLLIDDREGVQAARAIGLEVTGTLGVLDIAADRGLVDFSQVVRQLERTNFRRPRALLDALPKKHARRSVKE